MNAFLLESGKRAFCADKLFFQAQSCLGFALIDSIFRVQIEPDTRKYGILSNFFVKNSATIFVLPTAS